MSESSNDSSSTIQTLKELVRRFSDERDWEQFHNPKDLALALAIEVGEVLEHFRYQTNEKIETRLSDPNNLRELGYELADCLWLLLRLGDVCKIDLSTALREKLILAAEKYPIHKVHGKPNKYSDYSS